MGARLHALLPDSYVGWVLECEMAPPMSQAYRDLALVLPLPLGCGGA